MLNISVCDCHAQEGDKSVNQFPWADFTSALRQEVLRSFGVSRTVGSHLCKNLASVAGPGLKIRPVRTLGVHKDGPKPAGLGIELGSHSRDNPPYRTEHCRSIAVYSPLDQSACSLIPPLDELSRASSDRKIWFSKSADN